MFDSKASNSRLLSWSDLLKHPYQTQTNRTDTTINQSQDPHTDQHYKDFSSEEWKQRECRLEYLAEECSGIGFVWARPGPVPGETDHLSQLDFHRPLHPLTAKQHSLRQVLVFFPFLRSAKNLICYDHTEGSKSKDENEGKQQLHTRELQMGEGCQRETARSHTYTWHYSSMYTIDTPPHYTLKTGNCVTVVCEGYLSRTAAELPKPLPLTHTVNKHRGFISFPINITSHISLFLSLPSSILQRSRVLTHYSPIHTARWSRKIARKLPECLLCERKHVPGLIPGLIPGWDLVTLPGSVPERALCEQKPDQCRKGCVVVMTHFIVRKSDSTPGFTLCFFPLGSKFIFCSWVSQFFLFVTIVAECMWMYKKNKIIVTN